MMSINQQPINKNATSSICIVDNNTNTRNTTPAMIAAIVDRDGGDKQKEEQHHLGKHRQYWRDIILGCNDGLVSMFLLVAGVAGGGMTTKQILLTSIAGTLAGAVSMAAGEYLATKSQNEVMKGEVDLEQIHIKDHTQDELDELSTLLDMIGIDVEQHRSLQEDIIDFYKDNPDSLLKIMKVLEFGVVDDEIRSPYMAGIASGGLFVIGALPSIIPFAILTKSLTGLIVAACLTIIELLIVGMIKTWATRGNCIKASGENLIIAAIGGGFSYGIGALFDLVIK